MPGGSEEAESLVKDIEASCAKLKFVSLNVLEENLRGGVRAPGLP